MLVSGLGDPIDLLQPLISASNITAVAKVAQKIPTKVNYRKYLTF